MESEPIDDEQQTQADQPKPRPIITKMVLENFKSYAGKKEIGPFHKCFSAVVGPNGSGKSNVIDAMLFVFGKRAKQMRQSKVSQLIHSSKEHPNLEMASVTVFFAFIVDGDGDEFEIVPGSEFTIKRTAQSDNKSNYYLDGKSSGYKEVTDRVKEIGIDLTTSRFLILQGEVEQISLMKPKAPTPHETGMLEYLEDIIGSNHYVEHIETAATEVDGLNEIRGEKLNRLKSVEKEKEALEGSKTEAEEFLRLEKELQAHEAVVLQKHRVEASMAVHDVQETKSTLEQQLQEQAKKKDEMHDEEKALAKRYKAVSKEYEATGEAMQDAKEKFAACERKDIKRREDLKHSKAKLKKLAAGKAKEEEKLKKSQAQIQTDTASIASKEAELEDAKKAHAHETSVLDSMFAGLQQETEPFRVKLEKHEAELEPLAKDVTNARSEYEVSDAELKLLTSRVEEGATKLESALAEKVEMESRIEMATSHLEKYKTDLVHAQKKLSKVSKNLEEVKSAEQTGTTKLKSQRAQLEEQRRNAHSQQSRSTLLAALMEAQSNGKLTGILGRLGDLGTIAPEYDVAITTACPQLNYIVAESAKAAQMAVALLKKNKLGVATFMMLDSINVNPRNMEPRETPEGVPRLFDLVQVRDEKVRPAFYKALQETLVASDLDQASRIGYSNKRRLRVVTLAGQMIESSGAMSGGGDRVKRGGMSAKEAMPADEIATLETDVESGSEEVARLRESQRTLIKEEKALQAQISDLEFELKRAEMEALEVQKQVKSIEKHIKQLQSQRNGPSKEDKDRQTELVGIVTTLKETLEEKEEAAAPLRETIAKLKDEMMAVGGNKVEKQRNKVSGLEGKVDEVNKELSKLQVQISSATKQVQTAEKALKTKTKELEDTTQAIASAEEEIKSIEDGAFEVLQAYKEAEKALAEKHKEVSAIEKEYEEKKTHLDTIRSSEVDLTNQLDDCKRVMKDNQKKVDQFTAQLRKLRKEVNEDEHSSPASDSAAATEEAAAEEEEAIEENVEASASEEVPEEPENNKNLVMEGLFKDLSDEQLSRLMMDDLQHEIAVVSETLQTMKPNMGAIEEYRRKERDYNDRMAELDTVTETRDTAKTKLESLRKQRLDEFMTGFAVISMKLKEMYQMITMGGDAELELVDSLDPFSEGIVFSVRPPKKSWKNITNLSGGEKTLSSLALVFALHHYKPTPLYVMDEIDAALDFKNVSIVANYVKDRTKNAQFIIISLRNNMFELANRLVGIYKTHDATKSITINPGNFVIGETAATMSSA
jgi:structural maintenance of chromosome 4